MTGQLRDNEAEIRALPGSSNCHFEKSATTSRTGGMRMAPGRGRGHLCWRPLIFKKFFNLCFIGHVGFDEHRTD